MIHTLTGLLSRWRALATAGGAAALAASALMLASDGHRGHSGSDRGDGCHPVAVQP